RLKEQEKIIRDRMPAIEEVARAFRIIHEEKLYRLSYKTFDEYCKQVWNFGKDKAYSLIKHDGITSQRGSSTSENPTTSDNESSKLDASSETKPANSEDVSKSNEPSSDANGQSDQPAPKVGEPPEPILDDIGKPVPPLLVPIFQDRAKFGKVAAALNRDA